MYAQTFSLLFAFSSSLSPWFPLYFAPFLFPCILYMCTIMFLKKLLLVLWFILCVFLFICFIFLAKLARICPSVFLKKFNWCWSWKVERNRKNCTDTNNKIQIIHPIRENTRFFLLLVFLFELQFESVQ